MREKRGDAVDFELCSIPRRIRAERLLEDARAAAKAAGVGMVVRGQGNDRAVWLYWPDGRILRVWYPEDGRVNDADLRELAEVVEELRREAGA